MYFRQVLGIPCSCDLTVCCTAGSQCVLQAMGTSCQAAVGRLGRRMGRGFWHVGRRGKQSSLQHHRDDLQPRSDCTAGLQSVLQAAGASCCGVAGEAAVADGEGAAGAVAVAVAALVSQPPALT